MKKENFFKVFLLSFSMLFILIQGCGSGGGGDKSQNREEGIYIPSNVKMLKIEPFIPDVNRDNVKYIEVSDTASLQSAIDNAEPYTTITLLDGIYDEIIIRNKQYLTIRAKNRLESSFSNKLADNGIHIENSSYITIQDFLAQDFKNYFIFSPSWKEVKDENGASQRLYEPASHHIYISGCEIRQQVAGIFSGANSHDWTVDRCSFHDLTKSYAWYSLGYHHTLQNSLLYKIDNFYMSIRGYVAKYGENEIIPRVADIPDLNSKRLDYGDWTHLIINNTFGVQVDNFTGEGDADRGAGIAFYVGGKNALDGEDPDEDERRYLPPQNVHIENNIFYYNHGGDGIYMNKNYGFNKKDVSHGLPIFGTVLKNNVTNGRKLITTQYEPDLTMIANFATVQGSNTKDVLDSELGLNAPQDNDYTLQNDAVLLIDKGSRSNYDPKYDFSGKKRGTVVDIGAFEL